jgi:hypothetical protein
MLSIAWIGSIRGYLLLLISAFTGPFFDAEYNLEYNCAAHLAIGSFLIFFGIKMAMVRQYYWTFLRSFSLKHF